MIISGFPGIGKSHFFKTCPDSLVCCDSDSSTFPKDDFPSNYIRHIKEKMADTDILLVSSHQEVRDALLENGIGFTLVYPEAGLRDEYLERYRNRGSDDGFLKLLLKMWHQWIADIEQEDNPLCKKVLLGPGKYLSDLKLNVTAGRYPKKR